MERLAREPTQRYGAKQRADPATVVRLLVLAAVLLLLVNESFRQTLWSLRLQAVVDHFHNPAAHLSQQSFQILLKLERGVGIDGLSQKHYDALEEFFDNRFRSIPTLFENSLQIRGDHDCQHQTVMVILVHGGVPSSKDGFSCQTGLFRGIRLFLQDHLPLKGFTNPLSRHKNANLFGFRPE